MASASGPRQTGRFPGDMAVFLEPDRKNVSPLGHEGHGAQLYSSTAAPETNPDATIPFFTHTAIALFLKIIHTFFFFLVRAFICVCNFHTVQFMT